MLTGGLHVIRRLTLPGSYTVDAISPDGRWLYLIHYTARRNLLRYEVRAYDLPAGGCCARRSRPARARRGHAGTPTPAS